MFASELIKKLEQGIALYGDKIVVMGAVMECPEHGMEPMVCEDFTLIAAGISKSEAKEFILVQDDEVEAFVVKERHLEAVK